MATMFKILLRDWMKSCHQSKKYLPVKSLPQIRHVIFGILPHVNTTKHNRDANSVKSAYSGTRRLTVSSLTRSRRKVVVKDLLL